ncbi:PD-(D/E)XK nuclease family protein [Fusibacter tunisiensis]|uniref:ATP-dependent helicase/nuclease subunit B n=1 Tax=Fusibacter tunisiensis TaxID=1008308 RepID=A0ABS2MSB5_9FIRM|nr:PD-(D/E)XK nuclease family protein [Fusibacter tunisiensis]MBM7562255.1 ATP-dependent helicase/nuclease subunit B [Fusibacter tunisiensis]
MIRLITGKAKTGKTTRVFEEIQTLQNTDKKNAVIMIVPEQFTLEAEKKYIEHTASNGFIGIEILSFKRLCQKVIDLDEKVLIGDMGRMLLLRKLFRSMESELVYYGKAYQKPGFLQKFNALIQELRQTGITPEILEDLENELSSHDVLRMKMKDIHRVYSAYWKEKETLFFDDEAYYDLFIEKAETSNLIREANIWVDGFDSFSMQEYAILEKLMLCANDVTLTATWDESDQFDHTKVMVDRIKKATKEQLGEDMFEQIHLTESYLSASISMFSDHLLNYPYATFTKSEGDIRMHAANSRASEIETCAIEIIKLVRDEGMRWRDIAVVTNGISEYDSAIRRVFNQYGLPFFMDVKHSVLANPFVRFVLATVRIISEPTQMAHVIQLLKTGYLPFSSDQVHLFELYVKSKAIKPYHLKRPFSRESDRGLDMDALEAIRKSLWGLLEAISNLKQMTTKAYVEILYGFIVQNDLYLKIQENIDYFIENQNFEEAQIFSQIWNKTLSLFDQMVAVMDSEILTVKDLGQLMEAGFENMEVGVLPLNENRILVGSLDRSRAHDIKVLFVLGVNDGILPEAGSPHQLISEMEKDVLNQGQIRILSDSNMFINKETFNIYVAITRPAERLYLYYAKSDSEGRALRPSYLISKGRKVCVDLWYSEEGIVENMDPNVIPSTITLPTPTWDHLAVELRRFLDGMPMHVAWFSVLKWFAIDSPLKVKQLTSALFYDNSVERLSWNLVSKIYDNPVKTSVSRLEEFVNCPFKYFVSTGLKPYIPNVYELKYPDMGILLHAILEAFGKWMFTSQMNWSDLSLDEKNQVLDAILETSLDKELFDSKYQYLYMIRKLKRVAKRSVDTLSHHLEVGLFKTQAFELIFSDGPAGVPPIVIPLEGDRKLFVRGVIDRIDLLERDGKHYVKIIDYKSGMKEMSLSDVYHGLQMQLMVYLNACLEHPDYFKVKELIPAGAFYFKIDDPIIEKVLNDREAIEADIYNHLKLDGLILNDMEIIKAFDSDFESKSQSSVVSVKVKKDGTLSKSSGALTQEDFQSITSWVTNKMKTIGNAITQGEISVSPAKVAGRASCDYCQYKALCQFDPKFFGNQYRSLTKLSDEEAIACIKAGGQDD